MKYALIAIALFGAASAATYVRYESLDPCDWMVHDLARKSNLPRFIIEAKVRADFMLEGITDPSPYECLSAWWKLRADDAAAAS